MNYCLATTADLTLPAKRALLRQGEDHGKKQKAEGGRKRRTEGRKGRGREDYRNGKESNFTVYPFRK